MLLLIDRDVPKSIAEFLRDSLHHDVADSYRASYERFSDEEIVARAIEEHRIVVTRDQGYRRKGRFPICTHPGILILRNTSIEHQKTALIKLTSSYNQTMIEHAITRVYVDRLEIESEKGQIRVYGDQFEMVRQL